MSKNENKIISGNLRSIGIKQLLNIDKNIVYETCYVSGNIVFDDGVIRTMSPNEIKALRFILEPIVALKMERDLFIDSKYDLRNHYNNGVFRGKTIDIMIKLLTESLVEEVIKAKGVSKVIKDDFYEQCFVMVNSIYNDIVYDNLDYCTDIDIRDYMEILYDNDLSEARALTHTSKDKTKALNHAYNVMDTVMKKPEYSNNPIASAYITNAVNPEQVKQMLVARGFATEINSKIFNIPILSCYVGGMDNIYEYSVESRGGAKAMYYHTVGVEKSEYLARGLHLVTTIVDKIVETDCGSNKYLNWFVRSPDDNNGKSDLASIAGSYYLNEESGELDLIKDSDIHLIGKNIKLRNPLNCMLKNPRQICHKCFGDLAYNIFNHNNIGFISTTVTSRDISQKIISVKHLLKSAVAEFVKLAQELTKYFVIKGNNYYFRANINLGAGDYKMIIEQSELNGLKLLSSGTIEPDKINPVRISKLSSVLFKVKNKTVDDIFEVKLKHKSTYGVLTKEFIQYLIDNGYTLDSLDRVVVDMSMWDSKNPLLYTPEVEFSFLDLAREIKSMFVYMDTDETPESLLQKFHDAVNSKLNVNLAWLSTVVYAFTVQDLDKNDYRLGRNSENRKVVKTNDIIHNRSLGAYYGWEIIFNATNNPRTFYGRNAVDTPFDVILDPNVVFRTKR